MLRKRTDLRRKHEVPAFVSERDGGCGVEGVYTITVFIFALGHVPPVFDRNEMVDF